MMNYDEIMKLALERGFYFPSCEVYADGQAGFWEYGPSGVGLKNKYLELWRRELVRRDNMLEIDGSQIMSKSVFEALKIIFEPLACIVDMSLLLGRSRLYNRDCCLLWSR